MKKIAINLILTVTLSGCSSITTLSNPKPVGDFFSYHMSNDPVAMLGLGGTFLWQNDCLLFKTEEGELATPLLPAQYTKFKRGDTGVLLGQKFHPLNHPSYMGGYVSNVTLSPKAQSKLVSKASSNCILNKTAIIY